MTDDAKRDAVVGALHEVSNALTVVLGWIAEARDPDAAPEDVRDALRIVEARAKAARDVARRAIGAKVPPLVDVDVELLLAETVEALAVEAQRADVRITRDDVAPLGTCRVPRGDELAQIVTNLVLNAVAHAPKGSVVHVRASAGPMEVSVDVVDEGPGVAPERTFSIFEGDSTRAGGAGVGLRHALAVARAAGGNVVLVRDELVRGRGAKFRVTWPREVPTRVHEIRASRPKLQILAGTRVLIVEDDLDVTTLLESALEARGAEVTIARTAAELAERIEAGFDAVLVDLSPIANDVAGALALVKKTATKAAIVFITGSAEALPEGMEGAAWVRKPFEVGELVTILSASRKS